MIHEMNNYKAYLLSSNLNSVFMTDHLVPSPTQAIQAYLSIRCIFIVIFMLHDNLK